jgi:uncharacterized membrane protein
MIKLSTKTIDFCGKPRKFRRTPAKKLKEASRDIEAMQQEVENLYNQVREKASEAQTSRTEAADLLANPTKTNETKARKLLKKAEKAEGEVKEIEQKLHDEMTTYDQRIEQAYGGIAELLLEPMTVEEFIEEHDSTDMIIAKNLPMFYDMYMAGFNEVKIEQRLKQLIDAEYEARFRDETG